LIKNRAGIQDRETLYQQLSNIQQQYQTRNVNMFIVLENSEEITESSKTDFNSAWKSIHGNVNKTSQNFKEYATICGRMFSITSMKKDD
jgi:hypothetical protein